MNTLVKSIAWAGVAGTLLLGTTNVMAQQERGRGNLDPAEFRQRAMERYQETLAMSAEEWKVVQPLLEDVMTKQTATSSGRGFGMGFGGGGRGRGGGDNAGGGGRGGRGGFGGNPSPETEALQKAVESGNAAEIKAKLDAYRDSRKKKEAELQEAREKLRKVLTAKQEAQLVLMGTLN